MTVLVTADLHFSDNPRDEYRFAFQKRLRNIVRRYKIKDTYVLGDLTEVKDNHGAGLVNRVVDQFHQLSKLCRVTILQGNHDWLSDAGNPFFRFLKHIDGITWIGQPAKIGPHLFLPHTNNHARDWKGIDLQDHDWIFAHNTFYGSNLGNGRKADFGIPLDVFPADTMVISGDVHVPQRIGCVTYVGAPYLIDFGDSYKPRVLLLGGDRKRQRFSLPCKGAQKRLIEINSLADLQAVVAAPGDILKVRVNIKADEYDKWTEQRDQVLAWGQEHGFVVNLVQPTIQAAPSVRKPQRVLNDKELLQAYAKKQGVSKQTLKTGLWLLEKT